ncbi:MAG: ParB/RepB/Spo0J family partition protein [Oceanospirillaceae bacterium]|nr:ParB/RepB/Spo0J family partition protein [Oceanospirillaceae bacterium]
MAKKRGLGRGLDALLSGASLEEQVNADMAEQNLASETASPTEGYRILDVTRIQRGKYQPRRDLEPQALEDLCNSIKAQGVMQPIIIRPVSADMYEIIAGERRWQATQLAGLDTIPVIIKDVSDEAAIAMALIENIQRENLNAMEEAIALKRLQDEFDLTQQEVATAVGKSRSAVTNLLRLTKLTEDVRKLLEYGDIDMGHARALLGLEGDIQISVAREVAGKGMSVRQTEELVRKWQSGELPKVITPKPAPDVNLEKISADLTAKYSAKVDIKQNAKGRGKITISFENAEKLEELLAGL